MFYGVSQVVSGYHRVLIKVGGYNLFWGTFTRDGARQNLANALDSMGIGYEYVTDTSPTSFNPSYDEFTVSVVAVDGQSNEDVRQAVLTAAATVFSNPTAILVSGVETPGVGGAVSTLLNSFGGGGVAGTVAGFSLGTMAVLAVAGIVILPIILDRRK